MKVNWNKITAKHVEAAIKLFDKSNDSYPKSRNTFLIFNNKEYPAKHIRGLAYFIANKKEISKDDYSGGQELAAMTLMFTIQEGRQMQILVDGKRNLPINLRN